MTDSPEDLTDPQVMARRVADLEVALRDRDARLQRLTSQSLDLLDELTATRVKAVDRGRLQERVDDLTQRVRWASRVVVGRAPLQPSDVEIVVWALPDREHSEATIGDAVRHVAKAAGEIPVRGLWGEDADPVAFAATAGSRSELQIANHATPAIAWNNALAASSAPVVVLLEASTTLNALDRGSLAGLVDRALAMGAMRIEPTKGNGKEASLGLKVSKRFRTKPNPWSASSTPKAAVRDARQPTGPELHTVEAVDPRAFAMRREAWIDVGPFDGDLHGLTALLDWGERASERGLRQVGLPASRVAAPPWSESKAVSETDRLVALSRYRPTEVGGALGRADVLWEMSRDGLRDRLRAIWAHLPVNDVGDIGLDTLIEQSVQVIESTLPADRMLTMLGRLSTSFGGMMEEELAADEVDPRTIADQRLEHLRELIAHLQSVGEDARNEQHAARREADQILTMLAAREDALGHVQQHAETLEKEIAQRDAHLGAAEEHRLELVAKIEGLDARVDKMGGEFQDVHQVKERLDEQCKSLQEDVERLAAQDVQRITWIANLLDEVSKRRMFPRALTTDEQAFLREHGTE